MATTKKKDAYAMLGVARNADAETIKRAYRKLAREMHPDTDPGNPWAEDEFKDLTAAYDILSDAKKRIQYDRGDIDLHGAKQRARSAGAGTTKAASGGFASASTTERAKQFFRERAQKRAQKSAGGVKVDGADVDYHLTVDFIEAANGATKHVSMTNGKRLSVTIPPGTDDGRVLRLKGQGMAGLGGGADGDALIEVTVQPHTLFHRDRHDIVIDLPVTLPEAVLGAKIEVPTIDGSVNVSVPAGSNTGTRLRLKGKGLATGPKGEGARGDQHVVLRVHLPPKGDEDFKTMIEEWAEKNPYTVRKVDIER